MAGGVWTKPKNDKNVNSKQFGRFAPKLVGDLA